ncbi:MAG TPA: c-type cytochrome [Candidatus Acidoferrales bacterium]|nr:c-type cytochrome [Candidatus Acidoferrales bacterium]
MKRPPVLAILGLAFVAALALHTARVGVAAPAAANGETVFSTNCAGCHGATGAGGGPFPPLAGNPHVTAADTSALIATVLNGRSGPMEVNGRTYGGVMPAWKGVLSHAEIAAVLTYVRSAWGNQAAIVSAEQVAAASAPSGLSGAQIFAAKCAACHQAHGQGSSLVPPLAGNPVVTAADPKQMISVIVKGRSGPLQVNGKTYDGKMPTWSGQLSNADIAAVATYVRSAWGNNAPGVTEQDVAAAGSAVLATVGASIFTLNCARCHQSSGIGRPTIPALAGNKDVLAADPTHVIAIVENGRHLMPSWRGQLSPADIAAVLTYVRSAWGNDAGPVTEPEVAAVK